MKKYIKSGLSLSLGVTLLLAMGAASADDKSDCSAGQGAFLSGKVVSGPKFAHGKFLKGVELSHTHIKVNVDGDGVYDVAMDNVFAADYVKNAKKVPASLAQINVGDKVELCGQEYTDGTKGIHWVHTDCGDTPSSSKPNGFVKLVKADGSTTDNLEGGQGYCSLWGKKH